MREVTHRVGTAIARTSTTSPAIAAAATIAGLISSVRPVGTALPALEIAVRRRRADLAAVEAIGVHRQAHRAAGVAPFEAGVAKRLVQPLAFGRGPNRLRSRHDQRPHVRRDAMADHHLRGLAQVGQPRVRARPDERDVDPRPGDWLPAVESHELERFADARHARRAPDRPAAAAWRPPRPIGPG